ncbi:MAG: hypothetical protein ACE5FW_02200 [Candidatus Aenigmatarchaeota archaeon]
MLDSSIVKKINDFVYLKPRTVKEVAELLSKNWRTANRYVEAIARETGSISIRTLRGGTRGAIKIVYWNNTERIHSFEFQERLLKRIEGRKKTDFSPFDIYQYVDEGRRKAVLLNLKGRGDRVRDHLEGTQKQVLSFSGNLSWINTKEKGKKLLDVLEGMAKKGISIKVLTRVTVDSMNNVKSLLGINDSLGKNAIEIRHREHPLRGFVIDDSLARFREMKDPSGYEKGELDERILLFYEVTDPEWVAWTQKVFWHMFRSSIPAEKRMKDLESIQNIYRISSG